jgi:hypothetical protein
VLYLGRVIAWAKTTCLADKLHARFRRITCYLPPTTCIPIKKKICIKFFYKKIALFYRVDILRCVPQFLCRTHYQSKMSCNRT